jgi:hypothetical protein
VFESTERQPSRAAVRDREIADGNVADEERNPDG